MTTERKVNIQIDQIIIELKKTIQTLECAKAYDEMNIHSKIQLIKIAGSTATYATGLLDHCLKSNYM